MAGGNCIFLAAAECQRLDPVAPPVVDPLTR
jgi:hypothetical protein